MQKEALKRTLGLGALFVYGLGDILGAGIYALIGQVASEAGSQSWISFAIALGIAIVTATSYAELTRRHPQSGGASFFIQQATGKKSLAFLTGWLLLCVSIVSMATLARAFVGYTQGFEIGIPTAVIIFLFFAVLTLINLRGIRQSSMANMVSTAVETLGLLIVVLAGVYFFNNSGPASAGAEAPTSGGSSMGVNLMSLLQGAALAFYAFIGFEDLANIAEEAKEPQKHLPMAILSSLLVAGLFYVLIGWIATQVLPVDQLSRSPNPLTVIVAQSGLPFPLKLFGVVALFAVANTCLLNFITGSRLIYGMASQKVIPSVFEKVHPRFSTPVVAIFSVVPAAFILSLLGDLKFLASTTSVLILLVFCSTHFSLIRIQKKEPGGQGFRVPRFVPWIALALNLGLIAFNPLRGILTALGFLLAGILVWRILKRFYR